MLPGMGAQMKEAMSQVDDRDLDRTTAIIRSMTPAERADPKMINGSRRLRIAKGSGVTVSDVNQLVDRFFEARKMMTQMGGMGLPGMRRKSATKSSKNGRKAARARRDGRRTGPTRPRTAGGFPAGCRRGSPGGFGGGVPPALPPGMKMPDLSKLRSAQAVAADSLIVLNIHARDAVGKVLAPVGRALSNAGVSPDAITVVGTAGDRGRVADAVPARLLVRRGARRRRARLSRPARRRGGAGRRTHHQVRRGARLDL